MAFRDAPSLNVGAELEEINTEALGFSSIGGDKKLKLLSSPWPTDSLPPSSASLLSVASAHRLLAAAGPDSLVITSTDAVRKAFANESGDDDVISTFAPDLILSSPRLRHVSFSCDEDFLVATADNGGGLAVYTIDELERKIQDHSSLISPTEISTEQIPVRTLLPNPKFGQYFAAVLDTGRLLVADVDSKKVSVFRDDGVTCAGWSIMGKAVVAGLQDGTAAQYSAEGNIMATIPRPPDVLESYITSGIYWLSRDVFLLIHTPRGDSSDESVREESTYHIVKADKQRSSFEFHKTPFELLFPANGSPSRDSPPRFCINRLRNWEPHLDDLVILGASNSIDFALLTNTSAPIAPDQHITNDFTVTSISEDNRKPQLPQMIGDDAGGDSVLIGESVDLSSTDKVTKPIPMDDEFLESPSPLPAFYALNHQGILSGWWIVYDNSIRAGTAYPGLASTVEAQPTTPAANVVPSVAQPAQSSIFGSKGTPSGTPFGAPPGSNGFATSSAAFGRPSFGTASTPSQPNLPTFGASSSFGKPSFGATSAPNQASTPTFGASSSFGKPSFGTNAVLGQSTAPTFGATSSFGKPSTFGGSSTLNKAPSPWGQASSTAQSQGQPLFPESKKSGGFSGFAAPTGSSGFSSFGSVGASTNQSPFSSLGQGQPSSSGFGKQNGTAPTATLDSAVSKGFGSFSSTVTVGSREGSTLPPSWAGTPANQSSSIFGQEQSSFSSGTDTTKPTSREEVTPTPQASSPQSNEKPTSVFGLGTNGFKLSSSFKPDETSKNDFSKTQPSSFSFTGDLSSALGAQTPNTPIKEEKEERKLQDIPATPAFPSSDAAVPLPSATPKDPPPRKSSSPNANDQQSTDVDSAPLPPDFITWKPSKPVDDDLPPLAGSPAIKIEAPGSDVPSSPLDENDDDDLSIEEQEDDPEEEEPSPSDATRRARSQTSGWSLQDSVNQSRRIPPAAPTPPTIKSGASSRSGDEPRGPPKKPDWKFGTLPAKPTPQSLFPEAPSAQSTGFPNPSTIFPPSNRTKDQLRSPSPQRAASTSILGTRRQQQYPQSTAFSSSVQQQQQQPKSAVARSELSDLSDSENERIREELASEVIPSSTLAEFIAHQDYAGAVTKTGTPGQIEMLYRDINSMVDTVGLNSRSLSSFVQYHISRSERSRADLEEVVDQGEDGSWYDHWCLGEIENLRMLIDDLESELKDGRIQNVVDKLSQLTKLLRDRAKLLTKLNDIRRQIISRKDPERAEELRTSALPKELSDQQKTLRIEYARLLTLLGQMEEATLLLKSRISSNHAATGKSTAVPTVEAVKKTVNRLIQMTESKNNDIILLEQQMRKVNMDDSRPSSSSSSLRQVGTPPRSSRAVTRPNHTPRVMTTPTSRNRMSIGRLNRSVRTPEIHQASPGGFGLSYGTDDISPLEGGKSLIKLADRLEGEKLGILRSTAMRRQEVAQNLADTICQKGVKVTRIS